MIYQDGISFAEDADSVDLYSYGTAEDYMAIQSMAGHGKDNEFQVFNTAYNPGQYFTPSDYESPVTDQNELAALPAAYTNEYDDSLLYSQVQTENYDQINVTQAPSEQYSTIPPTTTAAYTNQNVAYSMVNNTKKRKASVDSFYSEAPAPKRINVQDPSGECFDIKSESSPYSSFVPTPTAISVSHPSYHLKGSPRIHGHQHSASNASQISIAATAPYTPTESPSFTTANTEHSPRAPATPGARPASVASNPKLIRTSTIPNHSPQPVPSSMMSVGTTQNFNPYTLYSPDSKARLHLEGDLDSVAKKWTDEQLEARRKIVTFDRKQKGNDIFATFQTISQNEHKTHHLSVSCIWWEEKKDSYVTSVDTIALLEGIVGARFTVEEKNRIRRNLEGFKPDTVSKAKSETEEFFKVIMGFPNPKPRNIEKDVKVFPWKVLSVALQKIIGKYSASYASTAGSIQHQSKIFRPLVEHYEYGYPNVPASDYHNSLQMASFPVYETQGRLSAPATPVSYMHMAPQPSHHQSPHQHYGYAAQPSISQPTHLAYHGHPIVSTSMEQPQYWHGAYTQDRDIPTAPASAPPTGYPREMMESASFNRYAPVGHYIHH